MNAKAISEKSERPTGGRVLFFIFGLVFLLAGLFFFWMVVIHPLLRSISASSWPSAEATITFSEVKVDHDDDGTTYSPDIHFEFQANGRTWHSETYSFNNISTGARGWVDDVVRKYAKGTQHECFYNPNNPKDAVLNRKYSYWNLLGLFTLIFVAVGGFLIFLSFSKRRQKQSHQKDRLRFASPAHQGKTTDTNLEYPWDGWTGPRRLSPETTFAVRLTVIGLATLVWNGISWLLLWVVISDDGLISLAALFMLIFVVAGVGLCIGFIYTLMSAFNPVVEIAISNGAVPIGQSVDIAWEVKGNVSRISKLSIELVGKEEATYTRGTNTYTDSNEFIRLPVEATNDTLEVQFGSRQVQIPQESMHSFESEHNSIKWSIEAKGVIRYWPDINESYPFYVTPPSESMMKGVQ